EATGHLAALDTQASEEGLSWDGVAARLLWREAAALPWEASSWVHADIHVRNLVTRGGRLAAILDWGEAGAGDPAQDLGQVWLLLKADDAVRAFAQYGGMDDETLARAKGEATTTAVRLISTGDPGFIEAGWRGLMNLGLADGSPPQPVASRGSRSIR
ncbi:MAG: phosphotransferase, partial [Demequinaceae bacterium]|nr:phosphotransferase [Demequinaceae bacterium]